LERLERFVRAPQPQIAVVYGRRRIGKSLLIQQALQGRAPLLFEALEERPKRDQLNHFMLQLRHLTGRNVRPLRWTEALLELFEAIKENPRPIVFDEFQWMANYRHELVSELKYVWDGFLAKLPGQKLILCGSIASFMVEKVLKSSALYGRIDIELEVPALRTYDRLEIWVFAEVTGEDALIFGSEIAVWFERKILHSEVDRRVIPQQLEILGNTTGQHVRLPTHHSIVAQTAGTSNISYTTPTCVSTSRSSVPISRKSAQVRGQISWREYPEAVPSTP
jgi:AAA+ ATPase superfamily predicted ATPase